MFIHSKLPATGISVFTEMSSLAASVEAINLGQGFPDYPVNQRLIDLMNQAMKKGYNQYAPMGGLPILREQIAGKIQQLYQTVVHPITDITITPGGTYAIYTALTSILQPGDEVIVFEPAYDSYVPNILVNGATPVLIPLDFPSYKIDWDKVRAAVTEKTKLIMLNSPHNPTGAVISEQDIEALRSIVKDSGIFILSDEVYEHLIFDGLSHLSILRYPDLLERSFVCFSFGKVFHCTGWKLGYCVAPEPLMKEFRKIHQFNAFSSHTPTQAAMAAYIKNKDTYMKLPAFMQEKRDYFQMMMSKTRFDALPSSGSYFQLYRYGRISDEADTDFAKRITRDFGVASIPLSAFYQSSKDDRVIRFCFAKKNETLEKAVKRLMKL